MRTRFPTSFPFTTLTTTLFTAALALSACSSSGAKPGPGHGGPTCTSGHCGTAAHRRAIPTKELMRIGLPGVMRRGHGGAGPGTSRGVGLEAESPAYADTAGYVGQIDGVIDGVLDNIASISDSTPEEETDGGAVWRQADSSLAGVDDLLVITTTDDESYTVQMLMGPTGVAAGDATVVASGDMKFGSDDTLDEFGLELDFDADSQFEQVATGTITIAAMPFDGGQLELWYDFVDFQLDGDSTPPETSRTTYWEFDDTDGGLEYETGDVTAYVRWGGDGGRYDHFATYTDPDHGDTEELHTDCWDGGFAQSFVATEWRAADGDTAQLDGTEGDCVFGPIADLPNPAASFNDLPQEGMWDTIDATWIDCDVHPEHCQ